MNTFALYRMRCVPLYELYEFELARLLNSRTAEAAIREAKALGYSALVVGPVPVKGKTQ